MHVLSEQDLANSLDRKVLVKALDKGFQKGATIPKRHHHTINRSGEDATLLLMPAWSGSGTHETDTVLPNDGLIGIKQVTVFPSNMDRQLPSIYGMYTLLDGATGMPLALMDGRILTLYRTAATSVMAATYLARKDSTKLLMAGTGALAPHIVASYVEVLGIKEVKIWGRSFAKASTLARQIASDHLTDKPASIHAVEHIEDAAGWADIISCATLSKTPLIHGNTVSPGTFVDLIGGYTPEMREADDSLIRRATLFVDTREGAFSEAGDIMIPIQSGLINERDIKADLFDLTRGVHPGRQFEEEITCFKSIGYALEDLVAAKLAYKASCK